MHWKSDEQSYEGDWKDDNIEGFGEYIYYSGFSIKK